jgi:hypothetical protein
MAESFRVTNAEGNTFTVKLLREGDTYGRDKCLTVTKDTHGRNFGQKGDVEMVEFYDAEHAGPRFDPEGQFVSRYYLSTLLEAPATQGLCLQGDESKWRIDGATMVHVNATIAWWATREEQGQ